MAGRRYGARLRRHRTWIHVIPSAGAIALAGATLRRDKDLSRFTECKILPIPSLDLPVNEIPSMLYLRTSGVNYPCQNMYNFVISKWDRGTTSICPERWTNQDFGEIGGGVISTPLRVITPHNRQIKSNMAQSVLMNTFVTAM